MTRTDAGLLIAAKNEATFQNRQARLCGYGFSVSDYEEDSEGGVYKVLAGFHGSMDELRAAVKKLARHKWALLSDSSILSDGKEIYSCGKWLI